MHPIGPELPISAHVACTRVCRQLYVLSASQALFQATVGVGTVIIVYVGVRGGGVHAIPWSIAQQHKCHCLGFAPVPLSSTTAIVQMSRFLLLFWAPRNTLVITDAHDMYKVTVIVDFAGNILW